MSSGVPSEEEIRSLVRRVVDQVVDDRGTGDGGGSGDTIALGADHGGVRLKGVLKQHLEGNGYQVRDHGTHGDEPVDYPDVAHRVALSVADGGCAAGIVVDGAGIGSCMVANKVPGVRAALCYDLSSARNSREHNHANVLTLGAGLIGDALATQIVDLWLGTPWGPDRHARRVGLIGEIESIYTGRRG